VPRAASSCERSLQGVEQVGALIGERTTVALLFARDHLELDPGAHRVAQRRAIEVADAPVGHHGLAGRGALLGGGRPGLAVASIVGGAGDRQGIEALGIARAAAATAHERLDLLRGGRIARLVAGRVFGRGHAIEALEVIASEAAAAIDAWTPDDPSLGPRTLRAWWTLYEAHRRAGRFGAAARAMSQRIAIRLEHRVGLDQELQADRRALAELGSAATPP
jgi:hypothetical protein